MSAQGWRSDVERLLRWTERDNQLLARAKTKLTDEERNVVHAVVVSGGDAAALAAALGPLVMAKLKARGLQPPAKFREPAAKVWNVLKAPLRVAWVPEAGADPIAIAAAFAQRYSVHLDTLTDHCDAAAKATTALAHGLKTLGTSGELIQLTEQIQAHVRQMHAVATDCAHPNGDAARWASQSVDLARDATEGFDLLKRLSTGLRDMGTKCRALVESLREWADAPEAERAARAPAMAARVRAARDVVISMHEDFLSLVFPSN